MVVFPRATNMGRLDRTAGVFPRIRPCLVTLHIVKSSHSATKQHGREKRLETLQWRHNERDCVSNYRRLICLVNRLFRRRSKKTSKLRVTGLCERNSTVTGEFPAQRASNAENVSIWWRHHVSSSLSSGFPPSLGRHSSTTSADTTSKMALTWMRWKVPVVFLLFGGYLQQTWVIHYVASVILDTRETSFSFIVYRVTCYRCMTRRRKIIRSSHVHPDVAQCERSGSFSRTVVGVTKVPCVIFHVGYIFV